KMMPAGSKYILYIPASLGYGDREAGSIPPGSTLIFEVEIPE
ncbi:MAG: FKBP-type peptidyl-prolyl cis-trans isomerase, partial [Muribaculaceae bacterium]|nr:FKBP-type peptidyl-prolyl cis-trans isomerase [Muribaculaceae bacterium]